MSLQNLLGISHSFIVMGTYTSSWKVRNGEPYADEDICKLVNRNRDVLLFDFDALGFHVENPSDLSRFCRAQFKIASKPA